MPRVAAVSVEEAVEVIARFGAHFETNKLPIWSSDVWKEMSTALNNKWTPESVYTNITKNRRNVLDFARKKMNVNLKPPDLNNNFHLDETAASTVDQSSDSEGILESDTTRKDERGLETFDLVLTEQQWREIEPNAIESDHKVSSRKPKIKLKPGVWTNVLSIAMWQQFRMPCAFVFKRAEVLLSNNEQTYIMKIKGKCKSSTCANTFYGYAQKETNTGGLNIQVRTRDTRNENHDVVKRPFNGERRKAAQKDLKSEGGAVWKKRQARLYMQPGDIEPPILPSGDVLRQARQEGVDADLSIKKSDGRDLIRTIEEISSKPEYCGVITSVGSRPFHVFYSSSAQLHAYKEYCRLNRESSFICVDATGSVVRALDRKDDTVSGHIFLYSIVINFDNTTIAVNQMLSEQHDTEFIEFWIKRWIRSGAPKPKEAVCDYSRALLSALCLAFNNQTVKAYINSCFSVISKPNTGVSQEPATLIRVDVAHLIHLACRWKCFRSLRHTSIKEFFVRCIALMVECTSYSSFEDILCLTFAVGMQTHEDAQLDILQANTAKEARQELENYIATFGIQVDFTIKDPMNERVKDRPQSFELNDLNEPHGCKKNDINEWIDQRLSWATKTRYAGKDLNPFYLPEFIKNLARLCREFPLWTRVGINYGKHRATSSYVESYFNDIKTRVLRNTARPIRVDKFIKIHARDISGATLLFSSKLIQFNVERCEGPYAQSQIPGEKSNQIEIQSADQKTDHSNLVPPKNWGGKSLNCNISNIDSSNISYSDLLHIEKRGEKAPNFDSSNITSRDINDSDLIHIENLDREARSHDLSNIILANINGTDLIDIQNCNEKAANLDLSNIESSNINISDLCIENLGRRAPNLDLSSNNNLVNISSSDLIDIQNCNEKAANLDLSNIESPNVNILDLCIENLGERAPNLDLSNNNPSNINDSDLMSIENWRGKAKAPNMEDANSFEQVLEDSNYLNLNIELPCSTRLEDESYNDEFLVRALADHSYSKTEGSNICEEVTPQPCPVIAPEHRHEASIKTRESHPGPTKASKYFRPYPEVRHMNTVLTKQKKPVLLANGLLCPAVKMNKQLFFVRFTCSFDSFVQILLTAGIDNIDYFAFMESSSNITLKLVVKLIQKSIMQGTYLERMVILKPFCPPEVQMNTEKRILSYSINAEVNVANLVKQVMKSEPSVKNIELCSHSGRRVYSTIVMAPNHWTIGKQGFGGLEKALEFQTPIYNIHCRHPCPGKYTLYRESNNHIFIELDVRCNLQFTCGLKCKLRQMPSSLNLRQTAQLTYKYRLAGVVAFTPGHYVAYCLRSNGCWELHNDMRADIYTCSSDTEIEAHLAVYIRKNSQG